jgi:ADP-ribosylglycohydrolase
MIGAIIGDVIGSRFEFNNTRDYHFNLWDDSCSYTDDTICTLAIADAILTGESYKSKLLEWCNTYPHPMGAYGGRFAQWIHSEDPQPYNSFGNGSAMRVSPVAWAFNDLEDVKREAEKTAAVSHNHPEGIKGAVAVAHAIWLFRTGWGKSLREWCDTMQQYYPGFESQHFEQGKFDETCQGTVPLCLQIICQATDFEDAIRRAISFGGDSDTIGAIVGSIAEARWGIPQQIIDNVMEFLDPRMREQLAIWHNFYNF